MIARLVVALCAAGAGCAPGAAADSQPADGAPPLGPSASHAAATAGRATDTSDVSARYEQTRIAIDRVLAGAVLPGAPGFDAQRSALVARAPSEPVVLVRAPRPDTTAAAEAQALRVALERSGSSWDELQALRRRLRGRPALARAVLLREGYLYSEEPRLAFSLAGQVRIADLFDEPRVWIQRGERTMVAKRGGDRGYTFESGPEAGQRARLLHLDRVGLGEPPADALHRDFRALRARLAFDRATIRHLGAEQIVADLRYGSLVVPSLLRSVGAHLELAAELVAPKEAEALSERRRMAARRARASAALRQVMRRQVDERLPFDQPRTESGQEDGVLRQLWQRAYLAGRSAYVHRGDRYRVFDEQGRPRVPQVCIDFVTDTLERAAGRWYLPESADERALTSGALDLGQLGLARYHRAASFVTFAQAHPEWFDVRSFEQPERIVLGSEGRFFDWLARHADDFEVGDIILIRGPTPWDQADEHTHAFFIFETDPLTGIPVAIAGNAGRVSIWSWETEARRAPERTLRLRIRPKLEWLESFLEPSAEISLEPPSLVSGY